MRIREPLARSQDDFADELNRGPRNGKVKVDVVTPLSDVGVAPTGNCLRRRLKSALLCRSQAQTRLSQPLFHLLA